MKMKVISSERRLCTCCMEEHEVKTAVFKEKTIIKDVEIEYEACGYYCDLADEIYVDEALMRENNIKLRDAYRKKVGLLTSEGIRFIRSKYGISQGDLCLLLGWGAKTITRYESYQIQDKAHDTILKKLDNDPEWFISLLKDSKNSLAEEAFGKYMAKAVELYEADEDLYLRKAIEASYAVFQGNMMYHGNVELALDKVVDVIRYYASSKEVTGLYKVKLMKLLWYADALSYKKRGQAITGLVYRALPMGAVPVAHNSIIALKNVPCEEVEIGEGNAYHFNLKGQVAFRYLSEEEKSVIDEVISKLGGMSKDEIVAFMHRERAYIETDPRDVIQFKYAEYLLI